MMLSGTGDQGAADRQYPTDAARRLRTHPAFPQFAQKVGLVRAWQTYGWPPQTQPLPGTDGSNMEFTCAWRSGSE